MKKWGKTVLIIACIVLVIGLLIGGLFVYLTQPPPIHSQTDFEAYLNRRVRENNPPAIAVVVVNHGEIVYTGTFGTANPETRRAATSTDVYPWYSLTKIITATAILQLQDEGLLNIDDTVQSHLPDFTLSDAITVRNLMSHTGGLVEPMPLVDLIPLGSQGDSPLSVQDLYTAGLARHPTIDVEPGTAANYINYDYVVLGALIEAVSGQAYADYVSEHIFDPAGMEIATFSLPDTATVIQGSQPNWLPHAMLSSMTADELSTLLEPITAGKIDGRIVYTPFFVQNAPPAGLIGSTEDAARFALLYANDGTIDGQQVISAEAVELMRQPIVLNDGSTIDSALGWWKTGTHQEHDYIMTLGGFVGNSTAFYLYPESDSAVFVMGSGTVAFLDGIAKAAISVDW